MWRTPSRNCSMPYEPSSVTPGTRTRSSRNSAGRPDMTASRPRTRASRVRVAATRSGIALVAGSSTIGDKTPSKSRTRPPRDGSAARASIAVGREFMRRLFWLGVPSQPVRSLLLLGKRRRERVRRWSGLSFFRAAGRDAGQLAGLLRVDRRPGRVRKAVGLVPLVQGEQRLQRLWLLIHPGPGIPDGRQPVRQRGDGELVGVDVVDLVPGQRRGHLGTGTGPDRPGAEDRLVRCVLVEVDEHPGAALLLPPGGGDE